MILVAWPSATFSMASMLAQGKRVLAGGGFVDQADRVRFGFLHHQQSLGFAFSFPDALLLYGFGAQDGAFLFAFGRG